jgi:non-specific serine/threonine protein kinase
MAEQAGPGFGRLLRRLRDDAGLTQEELAGAARVSQRAVSDLERGINRTARKDTAVVLADGLGLDGRVRELFVSAARGRAPAGEVLAAVHAGPPGVSAVVGRMLPGNLPVPLATFIGRGRELAEVRALVRSYRLVTLTGAGGCGKTRLAVQVAAELPGGPSDGVWLVELAAVTGQDVVAPAICRVLGIAAQPGRPALDTLLEALAPQAVLIVLDNCEHLAGGCAVAAEAIVTRCPRVHVVATSREPLGIRGETIYQVAPLSLPGPGESGLRAAGSSDAVALFIDRARTQGTGLPLDEQTAPLVISVCRRLDGLPLPIELAAARLRSLSLRALASRLDRPFRLLTGGSRTAPARQQTLEAAIDWSYSLLNRPEQQLLQRLTVFAGIFDLDAAEEVCGTGEISAPGITDVLSSLVDKNLVVAEPAWPSVRYRLLETIRQFAADRLAEVGDDPAAVTAAHCAHYLSAAETAAPHLTEPDQASWLKRLDADQANFRHAIENASRDPDSTSLVLRFGVALWRYWLRRHLNGEAAALLVPALQRPEAAADPALFAEALLAAASITTFTDLATSIRLAERAGEVAGRLGDLRVLIGSRANLARAYHWAGEPGRARALAQDATGRARQLGDDLLLGTCLIAHALVAGAATSGPLYDEAIACAERCGDVRLGLILHNNAGSAALERGDVRAARAHLESAILAVGEIGEPNPNPIGNLGWVLRAEHDPGQAQSRFEESLRISRRTGSSRGMAGAINGLACLASDQGDWHRAAMLHGAAHALHNQTGLPREGIDDQYFQESLGQARRAIGYEQVQQTYARGKSLSLGQVIDLALEGTATSA